MSCGVLIEGPAGVSLAARQTLLLGLFSSEPNNLFQRVMDSLPDGVCIANRELARFAFLEPISQVGNRRYLEQQLSQHLDQHLKSGTPCFAGIPPEPGGSALIHQQAGGPQSSKPVIRMVLLYHCLKS